jgi:hypothetical protein
MDQLRTADKLDHEIALLRLAKAVNKLTMAVEGLAEGRFARSAEPTTDDEEDQERVRRLLREVTRELELAVDSIEKT